MHRRPQEIGVLLYADSVRRDHVVMVVETEARTEANVYTSLDAALDHLKEMTAYQLRMTGYTGRIEA